MLRASIHASPFRNASRSEGDASCSTESMNLLTSVAFAPGVSVAGMMCSQRIGNGVVLRRAQDLGRPRRACSLHRLVRMRRLFARKCAQRLHP